MILFAEKAQNDWGNLKYLEAINKLKGIDGAGDIVIQAEKATKKSPKVEEDLNSVAEAILVLQERLCIKRDDLILPFKFRTKFRGSLHCEAFLASILSPITRGLTNSNRFYDEICLETQVDYSLQLLFVIQSSFLVIIGLLTSYRSIKTLLPNMPLLPLPLEIRQYKFHHTRLSSYHFSMHPTNNDSREYRG